VEGGAVYCGEWVVQPRVVKAKTGELGDFLVFFFGWTELSIRRFVKRCNGSSSQYDKIFLAIAGFPKTSVGVAMTAVVYDIQRPGCRLRPEILKDTAEIRQVLTTTGIVAEDFVSLSLVVKVVFEKIPERDHVFVIVAISLLPAQKQYLNIIVRSLSCRKGPCKFIVEVVFEFL
jgi:hypothetical protein